MKITDLTVEVRNASLARVGQLSPSELVDAVFIQRFNSIGSWEVKIPNGSALADSLREPGAGLVVTGFDKPFSGPTISANLEQSIEDPQGVWIIKGADDSIVLSERLAYPTPSTADITLQVDSSDFRQGVAETVIKGYVDANIGAGAPVEREITELTVATDLARGNNVVASAKFETLQELIYPLAQTGGLGFYLAQSGTGLVFDVYEPSDLSATIRMDIDNNMLARAEYFYQNPKATRAIVAGAGADETRLLLERTSTDSLASEATWGRRIEKFIDSRGSGTAAELQQSGDELLVDEGKTIVNLTVVPSDDQTMVYGVDWSLGDRVSVVAGEVESSAVVTEVGISIQADGVRIGATVGTPAPVDFESKLIQKSTNQETRLSNLERNASPSVATILKQIVNNRTGATLTKGTVVYVTGAQGNRVTVAKALGTSDATSATTFGVVEADIANNQSGFIVTEGSLGGLDTSAFSEGAPLYVSPTTAGAITATKPVAPQHMVLVGFVERSHSVNGSIFVLVQNGYELDELHNVLITSVADGDSLVYDATNSVWKNTNQQGWGRVFSANYVVSPSTGTASSSTLTTDYVTYCVPIYFGADVTLDMIGIQVGTAVTTSAVRLGIYSPGADGKPATRLLDAGTVATTSTGVKTITISLALKAGIYWLAAKSDLSGNANVYKHNTPLWPSFTTTNAFADFTPTGFQSAAGTSGSALPSPFGTTTASSVYPFIFVRAN